MKKKYILFKKTIVFCLLSMISLHAGAQLSGTYTIGSGTSDFLTLKDACDSLTLAGVSGPVIFNIEDGTYTDTIQLDSISGVSATNTITFQSLAGDSANVTIQNSNYYVCEVKVNHVIFKNLTIKANSSYDAINFQGTECLTVEFCSVYSMSNSGVRAVNYSNSPFTELKNISITNSTFTGNRGINVDGDNISNVTIENNEVHTNSRAIQVYGDYKATDVTINNSNISSMTSDGIIIEGYNTIIKNITLTNLTIDSRYEGISMYSDQTIENVTVENTGIEGQYPAYNYTGIYMEGYASGTTDITINNVTIDSVYNGISLNSDYLIEDINITNAAIDAYYYGVFAEGTYGSVNNFSLSGSNVAADGRYGVQIGSDANLNNISFTNDSVTSSTRDAIYLYGQDVEGITLDNLFAKADTTGSGDEGFYAYSNGNLTNINVTNSHFIGGRGISLEAEQTFENILFDNVIGHGRYLSSTYSGYGLYLAVNYGYGENLEIRNSTFLSDTGYAAYIEGNDASLDLTVINNSTFEGFRAGLYLSTYAGFSRGYITNSTFKGELSSTQSTYGLYLYNDYGAMQNVIIDSCTIEGSYCGVYTEGYYNLGMNRIGIKNNTINVWSMSSTPYGVYAYSDTRVRGYDVVNNTINIHTSGSSAYGVYVGGYGGTSASSISNNNIQVEGTSAYGIYAEYLKDSIRIAYNMIDTNGSDYIYSGIYFTGEYVNTKEVIVEGNHIPSTRYGIYGEYLSNIEIKNNTVLNKDYSTPYNLYLYNITPGKFNISGNKLLNYDGQYGIYFSDVRLDSTQKGIVSNNFVGNARYGLYMYNTKNVLFANNSLTSYFDSDVVELDDYNQNLEFYNNIFQVDSANFNSSIFYIINTLQIKGMDFNVTNIDTSHSSYLYDDYYNNYYQLPEWNAYAGFDANSFVQEVNFVNDSTNLHILCNNAALNVGMPLAEVTTDIDGHVRTATPTIGADEILGGSNEIFAADTLDYRSYSSITLDAGSTSGANVYNWNTGATTQTIVVDTNGWYRVTLTDACGVYTDSVYVLVNGTASIDENEVSLNISVYPNPSTGEFTVSIDNITNDELNLSVLTVAGQVVYNEVINSSNATQRVIDITNQPKGVYFLQIISNDSKTIQRIVKQ